MPTAARSRTSQKSSSRVLESAPRGNRGAARPADTPWRQHWSMRPWAARLAAVGFVKLSGCRRIGGSAMR